MAFSFASQVGGDHFNEDETELQFLRSKPTCFVILGKPGCGKTTLAHKLAQYWRCELVNGTDTIQKEIDIGTEVGNKMQEVLWKGEALSNDFVMQLIREKVASLEVAHYGYVLDGMPVIEQNSLSVQDQIEIIKNWKFKPDIIINIRCPDVDVIARRTDLRTDTTTGEVYPRQMWDPPQSKNNAKASTNNEEEEDFEEEDDEGFEEQVVTEFPEIDKETKERLVVAPECLDQHVAAANALYKDVALRSLEMYMTDHYQQFVVELDGNLPPMTIFQQLVSKLETYSLRPAVVPTRLQSQDEEELPDEIESDELLRLLASYQLPAPRYRWRRSKWGRLCPVALKEGSIVQGKPDLAVSFLDKMYVMSSPEMTTKFLKNPRPYLLPPMPASPCKIAVLGFPLSGKTSVCGVLAEKYKANVFDMKELIKPKFEEARKALIEKVKQESLESALVLVQNKLEQEAIERNEQRKAKAEEAAAPAEPQEDAETTDAVSDEPSDSTSLIQNDDSIIAPTEAREPSPVPPVTEEHEEVQKIVAEAVKNAETQEIKLPADVYAAVLKGAIDEMIKERLLLDSTAPKDGCWILDNFPETRDQWTAMIDAGVVPDEVLMLADKTPNVEVVRQRYYETNKDSITLQFRDRLIKEKEKLLVEEEQMKARALQEMEELSKQASDTAASEDGADQSTKADDESEKKDEDKEEKEADVRSSYDDSILVKLRKELVDLTDSSTYIGVPPYDAPEFKIFRDNLREFDREWGQLQNTISGSGVSKSIQVDIKGKTSTDVLDVAVQKIEGSYGYKAWEFTGADMDEDEEDSADVDDEEQEGDEEALQQKKKQFGHTKHYDPVALKEDFVLWPGSADVAAKYREKVYYFKTPENREAFVSNPLTYLPTDKPLSPPPPRILILGARGAGKTLHGRWLAEKLNVFHISFRERLQELILPKTGRKIGPEHEQDRLLTKELSVSVDEAVRQAIDEEEPKEKVEEEPENFNLNDEDEAIRMNLEEDEPLPPEIIQKIIPPWWKEEPYRSTGFVLEGFPRTSEECQVLAQSGLYPDAALLLMVEDKDVITRLLPGQMKKWIERRNAQNEKKDKIREKKAEIKKGKMDARRAVLLAEREEKRAKEEEARLQAGEEEEEEDDEEEDIEDILAAEFEDEEEGEEEEEEQEHEASERMKGEFGDGFDEDVSKLQAVQDQLDEFSIPRIEVQASRKPSIVRYLVENKMQGVVKHRDGIFERVYPISLEAANRMLFTGYKHPSTFGKWDPVVLHETGGVIQPMQGASNPTHPVVYNQHIYFLSSVDSRNKFSSDPRKYIDSQPQVKPVVPVQIAIVGPPKSGKTALAERFVRELGCVRVSAGKSLRQILEEQPDSTLSKHIKSHLEKGNVVPDALVAEAVCTVLLDTTCTTRGYVLDGYPNYIEQLELLHQRQITPVKVIELDVDGREVVVRANKDRLSIDREYPMHDSEGITIVRHNHYMKNIGSVKKWYQKEHQNWFTVDGKVSKWKLWKTVLGMAEDSVDKIQNYLNNNIAGNAAKLRDLCITPSEFEVRLGEYGQYCPVSLNLREELVDCSVSKSLEYSVEFRSKYYKMATEKDMETFLADPDKFVAPNARRPLPPPELLPKKRTHSEVKAMFPLQVELNGYCPVTYLDGKLRYEALVEGNSELVAEYKKKLFMFQSERQLEKFMRRPAQYADLKLPNKLPPKKQPMDITGLPMLGYLEQGASISVIKALTAAGCFKPKFPFLSVKDSVLRYIAYYLKAFNPRSSTYSRAKYLKKLKRFEDCCSLISYLGTNMTRQYLDPALRPTGFDDKMLLFFSLEAPPQSLVQ